MRISKVEIANFRAIEQATVELEPLTSVIGANNTGKSAFLKAIDLFFSSAPKVEDDDFHNGNLNGPIDITISFKDLTPDEQSLFETNLIDGRLTVTRRLMRGNPKESGSFFVEAMVNPEFSKCRNEEGKKARAELYKELQTKFEGLDKVRSADEIDEKLEAWETLNPEALSPQRVGSFRGWKNVAVGQLKKRQTFFSSQPSRKPHRKPAMVDHLSSNSSIRWLNKQSKTTRPSANSHWKQTTGLRTSRIPPMSLP